MQGLWLPPTKDTRLAAKEKEVADLRSHSEYLCQLLEKKEKELAHISTAKNSLSLQFANLAGQVTRSLMLLTTVV